MRLVDRIADELKAVAYNGRHEVAARVIAIVEGRCLPPQKCDAEDGRPCTLCGKYEVQR